MRLVSRVRDSLTETRCRGLPGGARHDHPRALVSRASGCKTSIAQPTSRRSPNHPGMAVRACKTRSEEHTSELQSLAYLVCRLLLEKKKRKKPSTSHTCD